MVEPRRAFADLVADETRHVVQIVSHLVQMPIFRPRALAGHLIDVAYQAPRLAWSLQFTGTFDALNRGSWRPPSGRCSAG